MNTQKIWTLLLVAFAAILPFGPALPNILAAVLLAFAALQLIKGNFNLKKRDFIRFLWMNTYILFLGLSLLWSENLEYGLDKLLLLLFIPLFFLAVVSGKRYINRGVFHRCVTAFVLSLTLLLVLSFCAAVLRNGLSISALSENQLSTALIDFHFLGFSLYASIGLILGLLIYLERPQDRKGIITKIWPFCLFILGGGLFLLSSRTTLVVTGMAILFLLLLRNKQVSKKVILTVLTLFVTASAFLVAINPVLREKFKDAVNYENQYNVRGYWGGRGFRELIWDCAWHLVRDQPVIGVGLGDQQDKMDLCYRQHRYEQLLHQGNNFNAHNLFLQITISSGFIGLLFFLAAFLYPCMIAIQHRNWEYLFFILILLGTGITESHFNRNAVVLLFAFLNPLIFVLDLKTKDENTPDT